LVQQSLCLNHKSQACQGYNQRQGGNDDELRERKKERERMRQRKRAREREFVPYGNT